MASKNFEVIVGNKVVSTHTSRSAAIKAAKKIGTQARVFHWTSSMIRAELKLKR